MYRVWTLIYDSIVFSRHHSALNLLVVTCVSTPYVDVIFSDLYLSRGLFCVERYFFAQLHHNHKDV